MLQHPVPQSPPATQEPRVESDVEAGLRATHVLLTRVHYGSLGFHRLGWVCLDDGITKAPLVLALELSVLEATGLVQRLPYEDGHEFIVLTRAGEELLEHLNFELFGAGLVERSGGAE